IEFVDIAGLVKGASTGEGLGNQFLSHIKNVDAIAQVVRNFTDENVIHVGGKINPNDDRLVINTELALADLQVVEKRLSSLSKEMKGNPNKELLLKETILKKIKGSLNEVKAVRNLGLDEEELKHIKDLQLITAKPMLYVYNLNEGADGKEWEGKEIDNCPVVTISAKLEAELADLPPDEANNMLHELGYQKSGLDRLIVASYKLLNLITFITTGPMETKAWTVIKGAKAPQAAGVIHTDFEQGFIRAEVISWKDLLEAGTEHLAKEKGLIRMEGKDYVMKDGDVAHFHFSE
ncbi:MAG: redox-regulated ATPase YchF, partial [bacterium]